jgi:NitT/TauT family transport system ATP-binding protein
MSAIHARKVQKVYAGAASTVALQDIDFEVRPGEFLSILGPSGCGKSTLLRCVAGLEEISGGSLQVHGKEVKGPPDGIGMVFQRDALLEWRTIAHNVLLPIEFAKKDVAAYAGEVQRLLRLTGLADFASRYPRELSGGMRQRAAICRALVDNPSLLLMDEPFGALDALTRDQMNVELQRIWLELRNTVLFVTHGISEAVFLADRVLVLSSRPGRVADIVDIDLPRPRRIAMRETDEFGAYTARLRDLIYQGGTVEEAAVP